MRWHVSLTEDIPVAAIMPKPVLPKRTACMATHAPEGERGIYNLPCCSNAKGVVEKRTIYVGLTQ